MESATAHWTVPARLESVAVARQWVRRFLTGESVGEELAGTVELLVSELVTNAVRHAATDAVSVALHLDPERIRVEVQDDDPLPPSLVAARPEDLGGRGIGMLGRAAADWGVADRGPAGKVVWFTLTRD